MRIASWLRGLYVVSLVTACAVAAASCGGSSGSSFQGAGGPDGSLDSNGFTDGSLLGDSGGSTGCKPQTCAQRGFSCGMNGDGCGGTISCGDCKPPEFCGGGGYSQCGGTGAGADGGPSNGCKPFTCASLGGYNCGKAGDGCGGVLDCGSCKTPEYCGGGGFNVCGGSTDPGTDAGNPCKPLTACPAGYDCGIIGDGCGGTISCGGTCPGKEVCGAGGFDRCGSDGLGPDGGPTCTPVDCATAPGGPYNCGVVGDGCGGVTKSCGTCKAPEFCGGGGPELCGPTSTTCDGGGTTTIKGYVYDPGNNLPIYNALVYVPSGAVVQPTTGPTCGCDAPPAITSNFTGIDGSFTLTGAPSGSSVQIVVALGKWQITYTEAITACSINALATHLTLPSQHSPGGPWPPNGNLGYGNIPLFAVSTGAVDTMECVLLKMGINQGEFVNPAISGGVPTGVGRVHLYQGQEVTAAEGAASGPGAYISGATPGDSAMTEASTVMNSYDVVLFPCQGAEAAFPSTGYNAAAETNLDDYADLGGRVFTTHFSYIWLYNNAAPDNFESTANWTLNNGNWNGPFTGNIDTSFPTGNVLANWLFQPAVGASTTLGQIPVNVIRNDFSSVNNPPGQSWMYTTDPPDQGLANMQIHYTFDTPVGAAKVCGRVVYSDFHVENSTAGNAQQAFPGECAAGGTSLSPQEKLLAFMLFDLTSCVGAPKCEPLTCANFPTSCGIQGDGCGGETAFCNPCAPPDTCGGGGVTGKCGAPDGGACVPETCANYPPTTCGVQGDGCGGATAFCNPCVPPATCGGGGIAGLCGATDGGETCHPQKCPPDIKCGPAANGCGGLVQCGNCPPGETCGGGGTPGKCGASDAGMCTPETCKELGYTCGPAGDGCGNIIQCGTCSGSQTCGGGGVPSQCGGGAQ